MFFLVIVVVSKGIASRLREVMLPLYSLQMQPCQGCCVWSWTAQRVRQGHTYSVSRKGPWRWSRDQSIREEAERAGILSMCVNTWWGGSKDNRARLCSVVTSGRVMGTIPHRSKTNLFFYLVGGWSKSVTGCPEGLWSLEIVKTHLDMVLSILLGVGGWTGQCP